MNHKHSIHRSNRLITHLVTLGLLIGVTMITAGCGSRVKSSSLISFEQNMLDKRRVDDLKKQCPDLVNEAMSYYKLALDDNEYGSSEDSLYYLQLAHITWTTAERRQAQLAHRIRLTEVQRRYENAQNLLNFALTRKKELSLLQTRQARIVQQQSVSQRRQSQQENQELAQQVQSSIANARKARAEAQAVQAQHFVPGPYKKGEMALRSAEATLKRGDFGNAVRIANGARDAFKSAVVAAQPFLKKQQERKAVEERMRQLIQDASQLPGVEASAEMRGVVVSLSQLYRRKKLTSNGHESVRRLAQLVGRYNDLRIIIEGHTRSRGRRKRKQALSLSQVMADEVKGIVTRLANKPLKISALGRGDYAPITGNPRDARNERIDVVFFKPRVK